MRPANTRSNTKVAAAKTKSTRKAAKASTKKMSKPAMSRSRKRPREESDEEEDSESEEEELPKRKRERKEVVDDDIEQVDDDMSVDNEPEEVDGITTEEESSMEVSRCIVLNFVSLTWFQDDLTAHQQGTVPDDLMVKDDTTRDLLTIFSDRVVIKFSPKNGDKVEVLKGRWCIICK